MLVDFSSPKIKLLGKTALAGGMVGSGSGIASLMKGETINYTTVDKSIDQEERVALGNGEQKYTSINIYKSMSLVMEYSVIMKTIKKSNGTDGNEDVPYLDDLIHEEKTSCIYYIKKADDKKVRISPKRPTKDPQKAYKGRKLKEFIWKGTKNSPKTWYGYCSPEESELKGEECKNLPDGWTVRDA